MATVAGDFGINVRIVGDRWRHDINNDHFGDLSTLNIVIESPIGPWPEGTPLHYVIDDIAGRVLSLENGEHRVGRFTIDAVLAGAGSSWESGGTVTTLMIAQAVLYGTGGGSFTVAASTKLVFTIDAVIRGANTFIVGAVVV